ncbi:MULTISPECIES: hypothetical protein [Mycobacterium simiae complex]|uniref:Mce associated membrane protein n=3 Tax=Mycobacterium simiae complex TaxID=2249310 RepID=A0A024K6M8_9MYCO|nr:MULTISPECIES: hypothetical protein [Mycobacterium simiae complex]ORJ53882.1 hypothetical protein B5M45_28495 [Mycobacterium simiae]CDO91571.1 Mce associated membrane protein [Mycobacterium triplex]SOX57018.1 hypothetical protein MAAFP003_5730 [Mycobacterium ahvazicum]
MAITRNHTEPADDMADCTDETATGLDDTTNSDATGPDSEATTLPDDASPASGQPRRWIRIAVFALLPAIALLSTLTAAFARWQISSAHQADTAAIQSVQKARDATAALLSYRPDTVDKQLNDARDRLTGQFRDSYTSLTHDVVIPAAQQRQITAQATVPAAASVSASAQHAVVLVFVNQTVTVGNGAPSQTASAVRVSLDNLAGTWLISGFDPV